MRLRGAMRLRGRMRASDRGRAYLTYPPSPCIIAPRLTARVKYAPVWGGPSACLGGLMQAWSRFICDLLRVEELEVEVEPRRQSPGTYRETNYTDLPVHFASRL